MTPETEERILTLEWLKVNAKYFILDKKEHETIAVCWIDSKEKQRGYNFYENNLGWEFNPCSTGSEAVEVMLQSSRYDITSDFEVAVNNCRVLLTNG